MFGDLMGNMQQKQEDLKQKLSATPITAETEGIVITGTASKEIQDISIGEQYLHADKKDELEDLLTLTMHKFLEKVAESEAKASEDMLKDILPGMGGMLGM